MSEEPDGQVFSLLATINSSGAGCSSSSSAGTPEQILARLPSFLPFLLLFQRTMDSCIPDFHPVYSTHPYGMNPKLLPRFSHLPSRCPGHLMFGAAASHAAASLMSEEPSGQVFCPLATMKSGTGGAASSSASCASPGWQTIARFPSFFPFWLLFQRTMASCC